MMDYDVLGMLLHGLLAGGGEFFGKRCGLSLIVRNST